MSEQRPVYGEAHGKDRLTRRTVLRATGVSLAMPWLGAMRPAAAATGLAL